LLQLFKKYKSVLRFIVIYLGSYTVLSMLYHLYLVYFKSDYYYPDPVTHYVARLSERLINIFGYDAMITPHQKELSMKLIVNEVYLARIVEGCNAVSVMILFTSFILAFFGRWKITLLYIVLGCLCISAMNIARIAVLAAGLYEFPENSDFLHSVIFPLIIYGTVFILWVLWARLFSKYQNL